MSTAVLHPTVTWEALQDGNAFYCKKELYVMSWDSLDLTNYLVAAASNAGPIGMVQ